MERERLTITLKKEVLSQLDKQIDGAKLRNRSHAIEYFLMKAMRPPIQKALILTGGKGRKLRPITYEIPVGLIPINGKPLLEYTIKTLASYEIRDITLSIGHLGDKIQDYFGNGSQFGVKISYNIQKDASGTTKPVKEAAAHFKKAPFLLIYGDVLFDLNLADFIAAHQAQGNFATVAVTSTQNPANFGAVSMRGNQVVDFSEKPKKDKIHTYLISAGIYIIEPKALSFLPKSNGTMLEKDMFPKMAQKGQLTGYPFEGKWFDINTNETYAKALKEWKEKD